MLSEQRFQRILQILRQQEVVSVSQLAQMLQTSESTVRRDIAVLDEQGRAKRVYGGVAAIREAVQTAEADIDTKSVLHVPEKQQIARYAAGTIHDRDFVYIDAGTTTLAMIDYITAQKAVYVTNGIAHAKQLIRKGFTAYVTGGQLRLVTEAIVGAESVASIQKYNFTKCYMGTNGIDIQRGFTTPDIDEALIKSEAIKRSYVSFVLADHSKFKQVSAVCFGSLENSCVITDRLTDPAFAEHTVIKEVGLQ